MSDNVIEIEDGNFDNQVIQNDLPVLVDFWAPWCGPCRAIAPIIEELAGEFGDRVQFSKCNVDDNPITPNKFGIKAIPTLLIFKDGKMAEQITGVVAKTKIEESLKKVI